MINIKNKINSNNIDKFLNKIIHGDSLEILKKIPKETIDITITSPPYDDLRDYNDSILESNCYFKALISSVNS